MFETTAEKQRCCYTNTHTVLHVQMYSSECTGASNTTSLLPVCQRARVKLAHDPDTEAANPAVLHFITSLSASVSVGQIT